MSTSVDDVSMIAEGINSRVVKVSRRELLNLIVLIFFYNCMYLTSVNYTLPRSSHTSISKKGPQKLKIFLRHIYTILVNSFFSLRFSDLFHSLRVLI